MSEAQLTGMLARQRVRNRMLLDALECIEEIIHGERDKFESESAEWRRWNVCSRLIDDAKKSAREVPQ